MKPATVIVLLLATLFIGLFLGAGGGFLVATFLYTHRYEEDPYYAPATMAVASAPATMAATPPTLPVSPPVIPAGMRAMSIKADSLAAEGFIVPGLRVDVILMTKLDGGGEARELIVPDLLVLAVSNPAPVEGQKFGTYTLAGKPEDVEKLAAAQQKGNLQLALRKPDAPESGK